MISNRLVGVARRVTQLVVHGDLDTLSYEVWLRRMRIDFAQESLEQLGLDASRSTMHAVSGGPALDRILLDFAPPRDAWCLDLGAGKGLACITLARHFRQVTGVEISEHLCGVARLNMIKAGVRNVDIAVADAGRFIALDPYDFAYMFNPFPAAVMREVVGNLRRSLVRRPRPFVILYRNPVASDALLEGGFRQVRVIGNAAVHPFGIFAA